MKKCYNKMKKKCKMSLTVYDLDKRFTKEN